MIEASGQSQELSYYPSQDMTLTQEWKQHPFQMVGGIEVLDNLQDREGNDQNNLEYRYRVWRGDILRPPFDEPTIIGVLGRSGSGKGGAGMGIYRLLKKDEYLHDELHSQGIALDVAPVTFSLFAEASKLPRIAETYPELAIDPLSTHGAYSAEQYLNISTLMWTDMHRYQASQADGTKTVFEIESSSPTSFPSVPDFTDSEKVLLPVVGNDRGNSPIYSAAYNENTKNRTYILALEKDQEVSEQAVEYRGIEQDGSLDTLRRAFDGDVRVVFTPSGEDEEMDVRDLSADQQREVLQFMRRTMVPPQGLVRSDEEVRALMKQLELKSVDDKALFTRLRKALGMRRKQFSIVKNPYLGGQKTFDLDYFTDSLAARLYPELLPEILRK